MKLQQLHPQLFAMYGSIHDEPEPRDGIPPPKETTPVVTTKTDEQPPPMVPSKPTQNEQLEKKIAMLCEMDKLRIRQLSEMMHATPIRPYLSRDGNAGLICHDEEWKEANQDVYAFFSDTFFGPSHGVICTVFETELLTVGEKNGKNRNDQNFSWVVSTNISPNPAGKPAGSSSVLPGGGQTAASRRAQVQRLRGPSLPFAG